VVKVKICGIRDKGMIDAVVAAGADAIGCVINSPSSPRNVTLLEAEEIFSNTPPFTQTVAVLTSNSLHEIVKIVKKLHPNAVQLHGKYTLDFIREASKAIDTAKIIGVFHVPAGTDQPQTEVETMLDQVRILADYVDAVLVDPMFEGKLGGSGLKMNWSFARKLRDAISPTPLILAGGLTPENVQQAILETRPYAVDVSTGVERSPGVKDPSKIVKFVRKVREIEE
jgi:phosphoribosylanthranilate isomerase